MSVHLVPFCLFPFALRHSRSLAPLIIRAAGEWNEPKGTSYEVKDKRLNHPRWTVTGDVSSVSRPFSRLGSIPPRSYITRLI